MLELDQLRDGELLKPLLPLTRSSERIVDGGTCHRKRAEARTVRMLRTGRLLGRAAERFFRHIEVEDEWRRIVEAARARGPVVYVLRNVSTLDFLALSHLTHRLDLPRIGFVNELPEPLRPAPASRHARTPAELLRQTIAKGQSAALFAKRAPDGLGIMQRGRSEGAALLETLLQLQADDSRREIMLVPQTFVWTQRPEKRGFSLVDTLFGPADFPGDLRQSAQFLLNYKNCKLRAGDSVSLRDFLDQQGGEPINEALVRRLTYTLLRRVERERRTIVGPAHKAPDRIREEVLRSPKLQAVIRELAGPTPELRRSLTGKARTMLRKMQMVPDPDTARNLELLAGKVLERVYASIDVDLDGIERLRKAAQDGSVILLPSHKSHIDYIVLSCVLRQHAIQLPVIAAGDNLSFFPIGEILRRGGAFFIRRKFRGDRLYSAVVSAYVRRLLRDGWIVELFLEGGRSRTGKLLPPMLGLLNMIVSAALQLDRREVTFVPVSIGYERLMEEDAFAREASGGKKEPEDAGALLKLGSVLVDRFGSLNIQFGRFFELGELREELQIPSGEAVTPAKRRAIVKRVAHKVMAEINRVAALTPGGLVAMALLCQGRRGVTYSDLAKHCRRLTTMMLDAGARATPSLVAPGGSTLREQGIREVLALYLKSGLVLQHVPGDTLTAKKRKRERLSSDPNVIFTVPDDKRLKLDLAKNHIIQLLVDRAVISVAFLCRPDPTARDAEAAAGQTPKLQLRTLRRRVQTLSRLFKFEFMFRADAPFDQIFDEVLGQMVAQSELRQTDDCVTLGEGREGLDGRGWITFYATVLRNFLEAYLIAANSLSQLIRGPVLRKELVARALRNGERMFLQGAIEHSEAVSRPMIDNAMSSFIDAGYLIREKDQISLSPSFRSEDGVRAIEGRVAAYLRTRPDDEIWS